MSSPESLNGNIELALAFLALGEEANYRSMVRPIEMDGAVPLSMGNAMQNDDFGALYSNGPPPVWPMAVKTLVKASDDWPEGSMQFRSSQSITRQEARVLGATKWSSYMLNDRACIIAPSGLKLSASMPLAYIGGKWVEAKHMVLQQKKKETYQAHTMGLISTGLALSLRYQWTVWLGHKDGPRVRLLSDPTGAREVFRLRDIPQGRERRAALRNWVTDHWRKSRKAEDDAAWVARHLRGAMDFDWNGLRCRIQPPDFDVEKIHKAAESGSL